MPKIPRGRGRRSGWEQRREPDVSETHDGRIGFGQRLRRLRFEAGLSGKELARRVGWAASKVSRLEHGGQSATVADLDVLATALGVPAEVRDQLVEELTSLRVEYATWRRQLRGGFAPRQRVGRILDEGATSLRAMQTALVPGLLQTADYARAVFRGLAELGGPRDVDAAVHERMRRQEVLHEDGREFRFLLTEAALLARVGSPDTARGQLDRLVVLSALDRIDIRVLPLSAEVVTPPDHSFDIFDDRLVLVETITAELAIREPEDIARYATLFELYWAAALHGGAATAMITRIAAELPT